MNPLASFAFLIATAQRLVDMVNTRDNLYLRPRLACKALAARLKSGMRVLKAFLRRLIILIALDMEWHLVDKRGEMKRPHSRKSKSPCAGFSLQGLDPDKPSPWLTGGPQFKPVIKADDKHRHYGPVPVDMSKLYAQLEFLAGIAANPAAKAKRLAYYLARNRPGILMAPEGPKRLAGRWGTEVRAMYDAMTGSIMIQSGNRPPPLPPPRNCWPMITLL